MKRPVLNGAKLKVKMFWRWFQSDRQVMEAALRESNGYDVSPTVLTQAPANTEVALEEDVCEVDVHDRKEYCFILPSSKKA